MKGVHRFVTAYQHYMSVAIVSYKIAAVLERLADRNPVLRMEIDRAVKNFLKSLEIDQTRGNYITIKEVAFIAGFVHDFAKTYELDVEIAKHLLRQILEFEVPEQTLRSYTKKYGVAAESLSKLAAPQDIVDYIVAVADYLASQDSASCVTSLQIPATDRYYKAWSRLASYGLRLGYVRFLMHPVVLVQAMHEFEKHENKMIELFRMNGWEPLLLYRDGIVFIGTETSRNIPKSEFVKNVYPTLKPAENEVSLRVEDFMKRLRATVSKLKTAKILEDPSIVDKARDVKSVIGTNPYRYPVDVVAGNNVETFRRIVEEIKKKFEEETDLRYAVVALLLHFKHMKDRIYQELNIRESSTKRVLKKIVEMVRDKKREELVNILNTILQIYEAAVGEKGDPLRTTLARFVENYVESNILIGNLSVPEATTICALCRMPISKEEAEPISSYARTVGSRRAKVETFYPDLPPFERVEASNVEKRLCVCLFDMMTARLNLVPPYLVVTFETGVSYELFVHIVSTIKDELRESATRVYVDITGAKLLLDPESVADLVTRSRRLDQAVFGSTMTLLVYHHIYEKILAGVTSIANSVNDVPKPLLLTPVENDISRFADVVGDYYAVAKMRPHLYSLVSKALETKTDYLARLTGAKVEDALVRAYASMQAPSGELAILSLPALLHDEASRRSLSKYIVSLLSLARKYVEGFESMGVRYPSISKSVIAYALGMRKLLVEVMKKRPSEVSKHEVTAILRAVETLVRERLAIGMSLEEVRDDAIYRAKARLLNRYPILRRMLDSDNPAERKVAEEIIRGVVGGVKNLIEAISEYVNRGYRNVGKLFNDASEIAYSCFLSPPKEQT